MDEKRSQKIGIMGGTFDPIHYGHLLIAQSAAEEFDLDRVLFLPTGKSPHKPEDQVTLPALRCEMVRLAILNNPCFSLLTLEAENTEINYTCITLQKIQRMHPDARLYFIMGQDSLRDFHSWKNPQEIGRQASVLVAVRNASGHEIQSEIAQASRRYGADMHMLHAPSFSVSSREIRARIKKGRSVRYMLPEEVEAFIKRHSLYRKQDGEEQWKNS